jgi:molybdopterin-guanine dinucleotide biosynthesis protein A
MGRDKATLIVDDAPLWQRQLATLRALNPAELLISGPVDGPWRDTDLQCLPDETPGEGPLGALATVLPRMRSRRALVLAVDLPQMTSEFLRCLLAATDGERGLVPVLDDRFEPLVAVYPQALASLAAQQLATARRSMQDFVREGIAAGSLDLHAVSVTDRTLFRNVNTPADLV